MKAIENKAFGVAKQGVNSQRRQVLKASAVAAGGAAALSVSGAAALGLTEKSEKIQSGAGSALPSCDLTIYQHHTPASEIVTVMNNTAESATIDRVWPVGLKHPGGKLKVSVVGVELPNGTMTLAPGERFTFEISAVSHDKMSSRENPSVPNVIAGKLQFSSSHPAFDGALPVTVFDLATA